MSPEAILADLGLVLPPPPKPAGAYIPTRRSGNLLFVAGQIPMESGNMIATGNVPGRVSLETAQKCAVQCVLNALAAIKAEIGELNAIKQFVRLGVFVCSDPGFTEQPKVANAASELLVKLFGDRGRHARAAVGSVALPLGAPVEIEFLVEV